MRSFVALGVHAGQHFMRLVTRLHRRRSVLLPAFVFLCMPLGLFLSRADNFFDLSLAELMEVEVASHFYEDELTVGSSVSKITEAQWRSQGAEKTFDALVHLPGIYVSEYFHGQMVPSFRGFAGSDQYNSFLLLPCPFRE